MFQVAAGASVCRRLSWPAICGRSQSRAAFPQQGYQSFHGRAHGLSCSSTVPGFQGSCADTTVTFLAGAAGINERNEKNSQVDYLAILRSYCLHVSFSVGNRCASSPQGWSEVSSALERLWHTFFRLRHGSSSSAFKPLYSLDVPQQMEVPSYIRAAESTE